ncbi:hypothetical protein QTI24_02800 [Variovorax sp. J22P240]|uniref:hypothetical protein n=1 Tax=unclassified Variovorax TaxID=663243 RepID=UPI00257742FD|nr:MULTISPECIES: hypothetical protein [unclassified Variovorax]MDL9997516.1 hypothetical protein [Variovorax sp. J22P240]MDM0051552.1 hypothetical protein [Variovorax sp. J22R115]
MDLSALFDRVASGLFGRDGANAGDAAEKQLVADMTELVVETVDPRMRLQARYADKLEGCVRKTIAHLRAIGRQPMDPLLLSRAAWNEDPRLNAFFASADDVPDFLGRSKELRDHFGVPSHHALGEAYALLAMKKEERTVLGHQQDGDRVLHDVPQVTVSFSGHRLFAPSATFEATRLEVGRRIIRRLAQLALKRIVDLDMKAAELGERKAWLAARLRLVKLAVDGAAGLLEDTAETRSQIAALERELRETVHDFIETKASVATLDSFRKHIEAVFGHPEQYVSLHQTPMRLSRMGVRVDGDHPGPVNDFVLSELAIGEGVNAVIAIVRCPLAEMPPEADLLANAERYI